ncbi:flagellar assembly peptidoglycan hydrolase FlgJ [Xenorhabdus bovienii]|uniref:flagellar assembly peptidoglycan hydrolase FlgJ n=1 Tax=Xenorhabdus bovienii TaxID=40576 RepID=UPI00237C7AA7|nr:flagellar assembly peptidoglycan hydrolase FlgJ [Xenorhabdus bovienii]MDE1487773.1 flagellar assembly peptidoglycan hydrolase FlgJ [Xenorhabdus bovienii]MDE9478670.1 flagellar assembly peptidoglycan hydrolase FlgJ [Xenorhabdus bovienii]MDE9493910.1 flagellar assembly peptidoglycan hydrolase FlgJ [Xenorhabdus bovienii]MDE9502445.1 flagellar assembly peptidoglycan hydrolase FlgJ [Xenorhabdus bovienii]MDE9518625.1 flagellar assembly peptidoglycan hydrolase FlgJ [Xenorhabdus bovienii]
MSDFLTTPTAAYDVNSLHSLKARLSQEPQQGLRQVAQELEGVFVQMMLKSMRSSLPQDGILSSDQTRFYTSMYDQQIAQDLSQKGLGFADMIVKQFSNANSVASEQAGTVPMPLDKEFLQTLPKQALEQFMRRTMTAPFSSAASKGSVQSKSLPVSSTDFVSMLSLPAQIASQQSGIPHLLIIAQAALESGWGQREILTAEGKPSHNLFGIKAGKHWKGAVTNIMTTEYIEGEPKKMHDSFRVYGSYREAITDYVKLLTENPRYAKVAQSTTAEQGAYSLQSAGYATDPGYAKKLVSLIQQLKSTGNQMVKAYTDDFDNLF